MPSRDGRDGVTKCIRRVRKHSYELDFRIISLTLGLGLRLSERLGKNRHWQDMYRRHLRSATINLLNAWERWMATVVDDGLKDAQTTNRAARPLGRTKRSED